MFFFAIFTDFVLPALPAAQLTLLAWREETVGSDGFEHAGKE